MKIDITLRIIAILFILTTALLLILTVANVINSDEARDTITKLAAICGIIGVSSLALTFLTNKK